MKYDPVLAQKILDRLSETGSLRRVCAELHVSRNSIIPWVTDNTEGFGDAYARAKEHGIDMLVEETLDIADDGTNDYMEGKHGPELDSEHIQRSKIRVETRRWLAERMAPRKYGVLNKHEVSGTNGGPVQTQVVIATGVPTDDFGDLA